MRRLITSLTAVALGVTAAVFAATPAHAAPEVWVIEETVDYRAGRAWWNADPSNPAPGDAIKACDDRADGWGIIVSLDIGRDGDIDREATTQGHSSGYCTPWVSGDIVEGTPVTIHACKISGRVTEKCISRDRTA